MTKSYDKNNTNFETAETYDDDCPVLSWDEEIEFTQDLIRDLMFYALFQGWEVSKLKEAYEYLGIPEELVNETLNEGL